MTRAIRRLSFVFAILLMMAATAAHMLEGHKQPEQFGSLPGAMWWAVVTLTTTGYGDVVPVTPGGRIVGAIGVSGVLSSQDAQIARAGLDGLK